MRRLALACLLAAACSTGGGAPDIVPPVPRLGFRADSVGYLFVSHRGTAQDVNGQSVQQQQVTQAWFRATLRGAGDTLAAQFQIDSMVERGSLAALGDLAGTRGAAWSGQLAPTGQVLDLRGPRDAGVLSQMANYFDNFYPRLPAGGVQAGATWVDSVTSDIDVGGVVLTIASVHHNTAVGPDTVGGRPVFVIRVATDYTMRGAGSQSGQPLTLDGTGRRHVREYLAPDGRYLGSVMADTSSYDVLLTSLGMAIPGRTLRYDTLRVQ